MKNTLILLSFVSCGLTATVATAQKKTETKTTQKTVTAPAIQGVTKSVTKTVTKSVVKKDTATKHIVAKHRKPKSPAATAKEETIEIDRNDQKMVIEVKQGAMFINGDIVSTIGDTKKEVHKIVINIKEDEKKNGREDATTMDNGEYIRKAILGVYTETAGDNGARVTTVMRNSPADEAGLMPGDIIYKVNGRKVLNPVELTEAIADHNGGEKITIVAERQSGDFICEVTLVDVVTHRRHETYEYHAPDLHGDRKIHAPFYNSYMFNYVDNSLEYAPQMGIRAETSKNSRGVVVLEVKSNSPADYAGLQRGDVILRVDHQRVATVDDIQDILDDTWPNQRVQVAFNRKGVAMFAYLKFVNQRIKRDL